MIELSITAKSATIASPATPVGARPAGGFARTLRTLSAPPDAQQVQSDSGDTRQRDAATGKKLPVAGDEPVPDTAARSSSPGAKSAVTRRPSKIDNHLAPAMIAAALASPVDYPASDDSAPAPDPDATDATDDNASPTTPAIAFFMPVAPIAVEPSLLPSSVDSGRLGNGAAAGVIPLALAGTSTAAAATPVAVSEAAATPAPASAPSRGTTAPLNAFQLLDRGAPGPVVATTADPSNVAINPRIAASPATPRFSIAAAMSPSVDAAAVTVLPARQAFAAALAGLSPKGPVCDDDSSDSHEPIGALASLVTSTGNTSIPVAVPQVADSRGTALDLRHDHGLRGMIDHIEMLRDDANARDTRIRLVPDALGTVDVAVRRDGEAVHVRFSSANEATRTVLNDAQPRLAQLAEASGLRIAGSSVDGGAGGGQPRPQTPPPAPRSNRAPHAGTPGEIDATTDQRLA
jgi:hypothetical protein